MSDPRSAASVAATAAANVEHLLALKVMRLTRPTFAAPLVVTCDPKHDLLRSTLNNDLKKDINSLRGMEELGLGQTLILPQSFGNIYLGETFTSYVSLHNDSTETCHKVQLRCDLQTATQRIPLYPGASGSGGAGGITASSTTSGGVTSTQDGSAQTLFDDFLPGSSIDNVLHHEVKELGAHILVCEVTYSSIQKEKLSFRKFFKFQVMKPLDVKTKFYSAESDEVFLEALIQNVTGGPLCLEKVFLEPSQLFRVTPLNNITSNGSSTNATPDVGEGLNAMSVFGKVNCLQPQDSRQYLFCLTPKPEVKVNHRLMKGVTNIGKLDIVWRTYMGDRGRLQTSQLQRLAPHHGDVRFSIESIPSIVVIDQAFTIGGKIINNCDRTLELELLLLNQPRMVWSGFTQRKLGLVEPGGSHDVEVEIVAHDTGLQVVSGIRILDSLLNRTYPFDDLCQVFVCENKSMLTTIGL